MMDLIHIINETGAGYCRFALAMLIQSAILILLLYLIDRLIRKHVRAVFRYCIWMLVFVKLMLPPALALPTGIGYWCGFDLPTVTNQEPASVVTEPFVTEPSLFTPQTIDIEIPAEVTAIKRENVYTLPAKAVEIPPAEEISTPVPASAEPESCTWQAIIFLLWLVGVLVFTVIIIQRFLFVRSLLAQSEPARGRLPELLDECRERMGIRKPLGLRLSKSLPSPAACGLASPVIVMPAALAKNLSREKLRAVLLHELAHVKRYDLWVNFLQTVLQVVYFYNPLLWLANAVVRGLREKAVDEMVLTKLGHEAANYSHTLIDIAEMAFTRPWLSLRLVGVVESKKALKDRIRHILSRPLPKTTKLGLVGFIAIFITAAALLPMKAATPSPEDTKKTTATDTQNIEEDNSPKSEEKNHQGNGVELKKLPVSQAELEQYSLWAEQLRSADETIWKQAFEQLKTAGPKAAEPLSKMFRYPPADIRAMEILTSMASHEHVQAVMRANLTLDRNRYPNTRYCSLRILAESGRRDHVQQIIPLLKEDMRQGRSASAAVYALGRLGGPDAYLALCDAAVGTIHPVMLISVAQELQKFKNPDAIRYLDVASEKLTLHDDEFGPKKIINQIIYELNGGSSNSNSNFTVPCYDRNAISFTQYIGGNLTRFNTDYVSLKKYASNENASPEEIFTSHGQCAFYMKKDHMFVGVRGTMIAPVDLACHDVKRTCSWLDCLQLHTPRQILGQMSAYFLLGNSDVHSIKLKEKHDYGIITPENKLLLMQVRSFAPYKSGAEATALTVYDLGWNYVIKRQHFSKDHIDVRDPSAIFAEVGEPSGETDPEVFRQIQRLKSPQKEVQAIAVWTLGEMGAKAEPALPYLIPMLRESWYANGSYIEVYRDEKTSKPQVGLSGFNPRLPMPDDPSDPVYLQIASMSHVARNAIMKIGKPAVGYLLDELTHQNHNSQLYIVEMLGEFNDSRAFPSLIRLLDTNDGNVQIRAAQSLVKLNHPDTAQTMIALLNHESASMVCGAVETLGRLKSAAAIEGLSGLLNHLDHNVRKGAAEALSSIYHPDRTETKPVTELLLRALQDEDWYVRRWTARAMAKVIHPDITRALIDKAADDNERLIVRGACAIALGHHGDPKAIDALINLLHLKDDPLDTRKATAEALGRIATKIQNSHPREYDRICKVLLHTLALNLSPDTTEPTRTGAGSWRNHNADVKLSDQVIQQAKDVARKEFLKNPRRSTPPWLESLSSPEATQQLMNTCMEQLANPDDNVQHKAVGKLRYLGKEAFNHLARGLKSKNPTVRKWCVVLLGKRGFPAIPLLSKIVLNDADKWVRTAAADELGKTYDPTAIPALLAALEDRDFHVRHCTIAALRNLKDYRTVRPIMNILTDSNANGQLRHAAADALLWIDNKTGKKTIKEVLENEGNANESLRHNLNQVLRARHTYAYWPPDKLELRQLTIDAGTVAGESFGDTEINRLLKHVNSPHVSTNCLLALGTLRATETVPVIIASSAYPKHNALARIASEPAVEYLLNAVLSSDKTTRKSAIGALGVDGGRWAVPVLIELLDDPSLRTSHTGEPAPIDLFNGIWPDEHKAHQALHACLNRAGLIGTSINLASGKTFDLDLEIQNLKTWWREHGNDFLAGKTVPNPDVKGVFLRT